MRFYYDTEFVENGRTIDLVSVGVVTDGGREYYAVNSDMPLARIFGRDWLVRNVLPSLPLTNRSSLQKYLDYPRSLYPKPSLGLVDLDRTDVHVKPGRVIANEVRTLLTASGEPVELWADYGAYDHVALMQLWGFMMDKPDGVPMFTHDIQQEAARLGLSDQLPQQVDGLHDALADARHCRTRYNFLVGRRATGTTTDDQVARAFHETYERLAPEHGYTTRAASAVPWEQVPAENRSLMTAVVGRLTAEGVIRPVDTSGVAPDA